MITIKSNERRNLDDACNKHVERIHDKLLDRINQYLNEGKYLNAKVFLIKELKNILSGKPQDLLDLNDEFKKVTKKLVSKKFNKAVKSSFEYQNWFASKKKYFAYELTNDLNIKVCPYCNINFTNTIINKGEKLLRPTLDHFFPKEKYPILALSFYNLIPSCHVCNSSLKGRKSVSINLNMHPYFHVLDSDKDFAFDYTPNNLQGVIGLDENFTIDLKVNPKSPYRKQIEGNIKLFKLNERYEQHKDYVSEVVYKSYIAGGSYLKILQETFPELRLSKEEYYRLAYGNFMNEEDIDLRPMAKLVRDISNKFDDYLK